MAPKSLWHESTELSADSVESHPYLHHLFVVSTYQVDQDQTQKDSASPAYSRRGRCRLHRFQDEQCTIIDAIDGEAILDTKWCLASDEPSDQGYGILGIADASGHLQLHKLNEDLKFAAMTSWTVNTDKALCLSVDFSDRTTRNADDAKTIVSQSDGSLAMIPSLYTKQPDGIQTWAAHDYEAWIAAWDTSSDGTIAWSGGDDLTLKGWDMRTPIYDGVRSATFQCQKGFDGGVTSLQNHPTQPQYWAVGSYDEKIRIFDARKPQRPLATEEVGGGIWRTKWHPSKANALLLGCMHGGVHIVEWQPDSSINKTRDMRVLCVAEKPSIAKTIAQMLSGGSLSNRAGRDKFCRNYDFVYRLPRPALGMGGSGPLVSVEMTMTSVRGHMMEIEFPDEYKWGRCDPSSLFTAPTFTRVTKDAAKVAENLAAEARTADLLMIWTDCDREGEQIGYEIMQHCRSVRASLRVKRARFSALIANQIHRACANPVDLDLNAAYAVEARQQIDLRAGAAFTRLQTSRLGRQVKELDGLVVAEALYQRGLLSYPRTETDQYDKDMDFQNLLAKQTSDQAWGAQVSELISPSGLQFERPRNGNKNDKAHPPIHPTAHANGLSGDEKKIYDYVTRRFLASCATDAQGHETSVHIEIGGEKFHASGTVVTEQNYLVLFPYETWKDKTMPPYEQNQRFRPSCELREGETSRPSLLTEADLVALMDKNGIGTDATIAEHIRKVIDRQYVMLHRQGKTNYLVPSTLGMGLVEGYQSMESSQYLCKPVLRRDTESKLDQVAKAELTHERMVAESMQEYKQIYAAVQSDFQVIIRNVSNLIDTQPTQPTNDDQIQHTISLDEASESLSSPLCHCNLPAVEKCNEGDRKYWGCARGDQGCGYFRWKTQALVQQSSSQPVNRARSSTQNSRTSRRSNQSAPEPASASTSDSLDTPRCQCDLTAKRATASTVGDLSD
ncbi:DNA topoisomerase [Malassezia psittaci]|uniref:DNA topoisomerase n=1 Tax=Malassezia psittaci TaxID=1821823 RepID=A0AAF0F6W0_9BASI|nr:DNA topoisomerase [Malassezia psittaci]